VALRSQDGVRRAPNRSDQGAPTLMG